MGRAMLGLDCLAKSFCCWLHKLCSFLFYFHQLTAAWLASLVHSKKYTTLLQLISPDSSANLLCQFILKCKLQSCLNGLINKLHTDLKLCLIRAAINYTLSQIVKANKSEYECLLWTSLNVKFHKDIAL